MASIYSKAGGKEAVTERIKAIEDELEAIDAKSESEKEPLEAERLGLLALLMVSDNG